MTAEEKEREASTRSEQLNQAVEHESRGEWVVATTFGALLLALIAVLIWRPGKAPPDEVPRTSLVLQDGKLCLKGHTTPFTGVMVEHYETGALKSRSCVSNGLLHGTCEGWYTNGQLQVTENFREGVSHGLRNKWHDNGRKLSEVTIVDGKLHGTFKRWTDDGVLSEVIEMKDGKPDGLSRAFYPSGFLKAEASLHAGEVVESKFWRDGEVVVTSHQ